MTLKEEFMTYPSERAISFLQKKNFGYEAYGCARSCKATLDGDTWVPAGYENGKIPALNGVDVILFPLIQDGEVINIVAFEPNKKPLQLYLRQPDSNLWALLDLIGNMTLSRT